MRLAVPVGSAGTTGCFGALLLFLIAGCSLSSTGAPPAAEPLPPPGHGTLSQREVSLTLRSGDLQLMVTPLAESVLVATAPDTYQRLSALAAPYRVGAEDASIFLVSFFSDHPDVRFVPEEVQFLSRGLRVRPRSIEPLTPGWGVRRVAQRATEMAVYVFDRAVDLESDAVLHYGFEQSNEWSIILPRIQSERARARARAGLTGPPAEAQSSRSYLEIFR